MHEITARDGSACSITEAIPSWRWLAAVLDEIDYGIVLLDPWARVVLCNDAAAAQLDAAHPLQVVDGALRARYARDVGALVSAISDASMRARRRLLTVGLPDRRISLSVVPLAQADMKDGAPVLIVLGKPSLIQPLSLHGFATNHGLTGAESRLLDVLCSGVPPTDAARVLGVAISTIRSQIGSIRGKTGAQSLRSLVQQVAVLPPVKAVVRERPSIGHPARA